MNERRVLTVLVWLLLLAAVAVAVVPFRVPTGGGWFGYTPLTPGAYPRPTGQRSFPFPASVPRATCAAPVASAWHSKAERVTVRVQALPGAVTNGAGLVDTFRACRGRAQRRLATSALLLTTGALAWVFLVRPLRRVLTVVP